MCANAQGKFWELHDLLFSRRGIEPEQVFAYAEEAGVDVDALARDLDKLEYGPEVRRDMRQARRLGVRSTPTFFINGREISGAKPVEEFEAVVDEELELTLQYNLNQFSDYESDEVTQLMVAIDGVPIDVGANDYVMEIEGDGNGGPTRSTGWTRFSKNLGTLTAGAHTLTVGAYNNKKTTSGESIDLRVDDVLLATPSPSTPESRTSRFSTFSSALSSSNCV